MKKILASITLIAIFLSLVPIADAARGYIYDAATGARIVNAVARCETFNEATGEWELWDADEWDQNNPMLSDRNGNYGWLVPGGKYIIIVTADGYDTAMSDELNVPPGHIGVNIGLSCSDDILPTPTPTLTPTPTPTPIPASGGGGGGSIKTPAPTATQEPETTAVPDKYEEKLPDDSFDEPKFSDLTGFEWAENEISALAGRGIIKGISDNQFAPMENIIRGDFVLLLIRLLDIDADVTENFADIAPGDYYYREIGIAREWGLTDGRGDNLFDPKGSITRQEMFTLSYRAMRKMDVLLAPAGEDTLYSFDDYNSIADYAKEAFATLIKNDLVKGSYNQLLPDNLATRAETAVFIYRLGSLIK